MVMVVPNGVLAVAARAHILQALKAVLLHCRVVQLKVQVVLVVSGDVHKRLGWAVRTFGGVPAQILDSRCPRALAE
jgi:hypothetical protein